MAGDRRYESICHSGGKHSSRFIIVEVEARKWRSEAFLCGMTTLIGALSFIKFPKVQYQSKTPCLFTGDHIICTKRMSVRGQDYRLGPS
jgi:hypothetical protein